MDVGEAALVLKIGFHQTSVDEIESMFAYNEKRMEIFTGFVQACLELRKSGCKTVYLNGSFVTTKLNPDDFDACWEMNFPNNLKLNSIIRNCDYRTRQLQKQIYKGEFFPIDLANRNRGGTKWLKFFLRTRLGNKKGILRLSLQSDIRLR